MKQGKPLLIGLASLLGLAVFVCVMVAGMRWWTDAQYGSMEYSIAEIPVAPVAIVFGAGVWPDGTLSSVLEDRVETAVLLYEAHKVQKLLMTGDNRYINYNEPEAMRQYALARGVPDEDIVLDYAGRRTYDSCYRAVHIFGLDRAILVTQAYHLDRALFTADKLGLDADGVAADRREYTNIAYYWKRELLATPVAFWQVLVTRPEPVLGEPLPIFPQR